ncbi:hypothetical protein [Mycolicibacterium sphagni]|nr:hypothetical protein [Mycolicibacterium sphagni]
MSDIDSRDPGAGTDIAEPSSRWNRWYAPVTPAGVADAPRGYFAIATKG